MADSWDQSAQLSSSHGHDDNSHRTASSSHGTTSTSTETGSSTATLHSEEPNIPPADRGKAAWLFLFGCFWVEGLVWGLPFSFGVFQKYYSNHEPFASERGIPAIGTVGLGLAYFLAPITIATLQRWPRHRTNLSILGLALMTISIFAGSFATHTIHLVFTQGILYGIGASFLYNPFIFYLDEWFIERRGLAYGVFWAGTGICSSVMPFVMEWALYRFGFRITLRGWAVFVLIALGLLVYLVRPRLPLPAKGVTQGVNPAFLRSPLFWAFEIGNIIEGLGYFMPQIYLPSYAEYIGLPRLSSTLSISLLNIFSTFGLVFMGALIDRYHVSNVLLLSAITSTLCVFLLWGFATTETMLYAFSVLFGIFGGGYAGSWAGCSSEIKKQHPESERAVIIGTLAAGRGFGCVLCGPVSEWLVGMPRWDVKGIYGTKYGPLIVFTGITSLLGRFGLFGRFGMRVKDRGHVDDGKQRERDETSPLLG